MQQEPTVVCFDDRTDARENVILKFVRWERHGGLDNSTLHLSTTHLHLHGWD